MNFAIEEQNRRRESELTGADAEIARIVIKFAELKSEDGKTASELGIRTVTDEFNISRLDKEKWKNVAVGRMLDRLGFQRRHTRAGNIITLKPDLIEYLKARYGKDEDTMKDTQSTLGL